MLDKNHNQMLIENRKTSTVLQSSEEGGYVNVLLEVEVDVQEKVHSVSISFHFRIPKPRKRNESAKP